MICRILEIGMKFYKKMKGQIQGFNDLLNGNIEISPNLLVFHSTASGEAADGMTVHPTYQEVTLARKRLKNNKSPGSDGIPTEYLKAGGDVVAEHLHIVLQKVWSEEELLPE